MSGVGELVKKHRLERKWSLRRLAGELGVTAAYVADIEANRRLPSPELRDRLARALDLPLEQLVAADVRLATDLREWIEERPELIGMLQGLRSSPGSEMLIRRLARFISRRLKPKQVPPRVLFVTWESEIRAIAADASAWSIETGGDLFGRWFDVPTLLLATKVGPNAQRDHAHFRLDVEYLRKLSEILATDWGLRYFGDWHSHHRLGLSAPSGGDRRRIHSVANRNQFTGMAEIIVTTDESRGDSVVRIHPWFYDLTSDSVNPMQVKVLPGLSPVRQALLVRRALPEQKLFEWEAFPVQRVRIGSDTTPPTLEPVRDVDTVTRERALAHLMQALEGESGDSVEHHVTGFGSILVAKLEGQHYIGFALDAAWPMHVLEVHRLNREAGTTDLVEVPNSLNSLDLNGVLEVFRAERSRHRSER
jgi:transcriptional regulator with XRE-family HTH domain